MSVAANSFRNQPPAKTNSFRQQPDSRGHFGQFGGRYVAETLMPLVLDLQGAGRPGVCCAVR
jgi:tryptophan synthase beta chain